MNTEEDAKVVHSGTTIGQLSEVAQDDVSLPQDKLSCTNVWQTDLTDHHCRGKRHEILFRRTPLFRETQPRSRSNRCCQASDQYRRQPTLQAAAQKDTSISNKRGDQIFKQSIANCQGEKKGWIIPLQCRLFVCFLGCIVLLDNFLLIWRRHHYRWRAANFDLSSVLMAIL